MENSSSLYARLKARHSLPEPFIPQMIRDAVPSPEAQIQAVLAHRLDCDAKIEQLRSMIRSDEITRADGRKLIFLLKKSSRRVDGDFFR